MAAEEGSKEEEEGGVGVGQEKGGEEAGEPGKKPAGWQTTVDAVPVEEKLEEQKSSLRWMSVAVTLLVMHTSCLQAYTLHRNPCTCISVSVTAVSICYHHSFVQPCSS